MDSFTSNGDQTTAGSFPSSSNISSSFSQSQPVVPSSKFSEDYLSCDDILALGQRVGCCFDKTVDSLGFIDAASESQDMIAGTKMEAPLWMVKVLYSRKLVSIEVPKGYNETYREILDADSNVVDLHKQGPNFYLFGKHLVEMNLKESEDIARSLVSAFHQRFHKLFDYALNASEDIINERLQYQQSLDNMELDILEVGQKSTVSFKKWEKRDNEKVTANDMVTTFKKRKRAAQHDTSEKRPRI